jgi:tRNA A-37 threonylcarbamoyl transferase component Bud32
MSKKIKNPMTDEEFVKTMCFTKNNVEEKEYKVHKLIYNLKIVNVPKIYSYDKKNKIMVMQKIFGMNISDEYGEDAKNVPPEIFKRAQEIIKKLYCYDIAYPDITGYNFMLYNDKMYIIDFERCYFFSNKGTKKLDPFIKEFINGLCEWNPDYK